MKRLALLGLKPCPRCHRAVAYVMTEGGEHTLGIALDAIKTREISRRSEERGQEKFLTDLVVKLLALSSCIPREIVLDWDEEGFLFARVDLATNLISCSPQEAVALVAAAGMPLYATESVFEHVQLFHPPVKEDETTGLVQLKPKPTLH